MSDRNHDQVMREAWDDVERAWGDMSTTWTDGSSFGDKMQSTAGAVGAVGDFVGDVDTSLNGMRVDNRSIIARTRDSVFQFPIYISQSCPVNVAHILASMFNRVYTTYVQFSIAQYPILDERDANDMEFLRRFHTNITESAEMKKFVEECGNLINMFYQPIDDHDAMMQESLHAEYVINERCKVIFQVVPTVDQRLIKENARLMHEPLTGFDYLKEAPDARAIETSDEVSTTMRTVTDEDLTPLACDNVHLTDYQRRLLEMSGDEIRRTVHAELFNPTIRDRHQIAIMNRNIDNEVDRQIRDRNRCRNLVAAEINNIKTNIRNGAEPYKTMGYGFDGVRYVRTDGTNTMLKKSKPAMKTAVDDPTPAPQILKEVEIKRINDMVPYTIKATFLIRTSKGVDKHVEFLIGVKSVLHLIRVQDLADQLPDIIMGKNKTLQKIRYKTGEISWKEYMFQASKLKADAMKDLDSSKRWINTLQRLADYSDQYASFLRTPLKIITKGNIPIPNATMVLTQPDVTMLTNETGIDLSRVGNARRLARNMYLIAFTIIDASAGTMRTLYPDRDGSDWDIQSLASVDAENAKADNSQLMKELQSIVNRRGG